MTGAGFRSEPGARGVRPVLRATRAPAVVLAGDGRASKAIYGENKAYLKVAGRSMLARVVGLLQRVPEISEVWVVGDARRIRSTLRAELAPRKPLRVVQQHRNLLENAWQTYRRLLPDAPPEGRDPRSAAEFDQPVLYLSADLPFATPEEVSAFTRDALARDCDYVLGLAPAAALQAFSPRDGQRGIRMALFHVAEGCYRQNNLHLVRPARLGNRIAIEHVYEHRYQKNFGQMLGLAWHILNSDGYAPRMLLSYLRMHLALLLERLRLTRLADWLRRGLPLAQVERAGAALLGTRLRLAVTEAGGCAVDVDNECDLDAARARFDEWTAQQRERVRTLYGALPEEAGTAEGAPETGSREASRAPEAASREASRPPEAAPREEVREGLPSREAAQSDASPAPEATPRASSQREVAHGGSPPREVARTEASRVPTAPEATPREEVRDGLLSREAAQSGASRAPAASARERAAKQSGAA